jgi:hypothetical protein
MKKIIFLIFLMMTSLGFSQGAAPTPPARNASDVVSVFSNAYTDISNTDFFPNWGQGTAFEQVTLGTAALHYSNLDYEGINLVAGGNPPGIDVSTMTKLHFDIWTPDVSSFSIYLIAGGENAVTVTPTLSGWNSYDIDLTQYSNAGRTLNNVIQIKIEKPGFAYHAEVNSVYLDNIYFWKPANLPTLSNFSIATKASGSAPFTITAPTSTSTGAFSYSSSNTSVATVSGSTITITGIGQTVITATQAAAGGFGAGSITTTFDVTPPAAPTPTLTSANVISVYSDTYTSVPVDTFLTSWSAATLTPIVIGASNNTLKYSNVNFLGIETVANPINATSMNLFHIDAFTPNMTTFRVKLVDFGADGAFGGGDDKEHELSMTPTLNGWNSYNLLLSDFTGLTTRAHIAQIILSGNPAGSGTVYVDNMYFGNASISVSPILSNFSIPTKNTSDANFTITAPTSTSPGAFTYTSSNTAVATIVTGNSIHIVGVGTTTITATQAASGNYLTGSITASFVVTVPIAQTPTVAAPAPPARNAWDVVSVFSGAYTDIANVEFFPDWGQGTTYEQINLGSPANATLHYSNLDYEGINLVPGGAAPGISVLSMTKLHLDVWTPNVSPFAISLIAAGENAITLTPTISGWNSFDINLSDYSSQGRDLSNVIQLKLEKPGFAYHAETNSIYFDNVYFWRPATALPPPTITNFTVPNKVVGNAPFNLTAPTSNSAGAFTYTSSNTAVATISGSTVTIVGAGSTVITATQAATGTYGAGTIAATMIVSYPPPTTNAPIPTVPADRVLSLFSNTYTNVAGTNWFPNWGQSTQVSDMAISKNTIKKYEFLNYQGVEFASPVDASTMTTLHVDIWTPNCTTFEVFLINTSPATVQQSVSLSPTTSGWNSFNIDLAQYSNIALNNIGQMMFVGTPSGTSTVYLDNIYFSKPTPTIAAPFVVSPVAYCKSDVATELTAGLYNNPLKWYTVATGGTGTTIAPIPVTSVAGSTKTYYVSEVFSNGVEGPRAAIVVNVNALPATPGIIAGTAAQGPLVGTTTTATYSIASVVGATSYLWTPPTGVNIISGQGTSSITVNFANVPTGAGAGAIGALTVQAINANGCLSAAKSLALTKALPAAPAAIKMTDGITTTAITNFGKFIGQSTVLTLTATAVATASSYVWELPAGMNKLSGGNTNVITVNFLNVPNGTAVLQIGCKSQNGVGTSVTNNATAVPATSSTAKLLKISATVPGTPAKLAGQVAGLCGGSTYSYTMATEAANASSYFITAPTGSVVKSASHTSNSTNTLVTSDLTFTVQYPANLATLATKTIVVYGRNGIGDSVLAKTTTVATTMSAVTTVTGTATTFQRCASQSFSVNATVAGATYAWTVANGAVITGGQGTATVTIDFSAVLSTLASTKVTVKATNTCGVSSAVKSITLASAVCGAKMAEETVAVATNISLYPNPASSEFNVDLTAMQEGVVSMSIYTIDGATVSTRDLNVTEGINTVTENIADLASGIYFVQFVNQATSETIVKKLIKR